MRSSLPGALLVGLLTTLGSPHVLLGQASSEGPKALELHSGAATLSLGTAAPLSRSGPERIFQNPALMGGAGFAAGLSRFGAYSSYAHLAAGADWADGWIGGAVQTLSYSTDVFPGAGIPNGMDPLLERGAEDVSDLVVSGGYANELAGIRWGVSLKLIEERFRGARSSTAALDLGVGREVGPLTVGLAAKNLGREMDRDGAPLSLAERLSLGLAGHGWVVGPFDLGATGALHREVGGEWIPAAGFEVAWWPVIGRTFVGRVGVRRVTDSAADPVSFGGAFIGDAITLEYAYLGFDGLDAAHTLSVSWR